MGVVATCMKADTGELLWQERVGGNFSASPVGMPGANLFFLGTTRQPQLLRKVPNSKSSPGTRSASLLRPLPPFRVDIFFFALPITSTALARRIKSLDAGLIGDWRFDEESGD